MCSRTDRIIDKLIMEVQVTTEILRADRADHLAAMMAARAGCCTLQEIADAAGVTRQSVWGTLRGRRVLSQNQEPTYKKEITA